MERGMHDVGKRQPVILRACQAYILIYGEGFENTDTGLVCVGVVSLAYETHHAVLVEKDDVPWLPARVGTSQRLGIEVFGRGKEGPYDLVAHVVGHVLIVFRRFRTAMELEAPVACELGARNHVPNPIH